MVSRDRAEAPKAARRAGVEASMTRLALGFFAAALVLARPADASPADAAAETALFPGASSDPEPRACDGKPDADRVRCLIAARYRADPAAAAIATRLYDRIGVVAGVVAPHRMDGGYRGMISIVPALPIGAERRHLVWVDEALADFAAFFAGRNPGGAIHVNYNWRPSTVRFFRSVGKRTPSAYAADWTVSYNVDGSLMTSRDAVRETLFHEIFHLNDFAAGDWTARALGSTFDAIVARCGVRVACLAPYSPNDTRVKGGTYYAFQPGNGVAEYGAELAIRYYREQRGDARGRPFKCGPPENARAWRALVDTFFGGIDRTPSCPPHP
jgi:hypothetical protein